MSCSEKLDKMHGPLSWDARQRRIKMQGVSLSAIIAEYEEITGRKASRPSCPIPGCRIHRKP